MWFIVYFFRERYVDDFSVFCGFVDVVVIGSNVLFMIGWVGEKCLFFFSVVCGNYGCGWIMLDGWLVCVVYGIIYFSFFYFCCCVVYFYLYLWKGFFVLL